MVLADYPHEQAAFEKAWAAGKMREACLIVDETVRSRNLTLTDEFRKTDEDFYWEFVN